MLWCKLKIHFLLNFASIFFLFSFFSFLMQNNVEKTYWNGQNIQHSIPSSISITLCKRLLRNMHFLPKSIKVIDKFANFYTIPRCFFLILGAKEYFYAPIFLLVCCNLLIFAITFYNLWKHSKDSWQATLQKLKLVNYFIDVPGLCLAKR